MQLQKDPTHDLAEARQALKEAVELDKASPAAAIELGHFLDNVEDDPQGASRAYADGVAMARHLLIDGLIGQAQALRQLDKREEFLHCILEVFHLTRFQLKGPHTHEIQELLSEVIQRDSDAASA